MELILNPKTMTLSDCIYMHIVYGKTTTINDGKLIGFQQEEIPTQTANPSGDEQPDKAIAMLILDGYSGKVKRKGEYKNEIILRKKQKRSMESVSR